MGKSALKDRIDLTSHDIYSTLAKLKAQTSILRTKSKDKSVVYHADKIDQCLVHLEYILNTIYQSIEKSEVDFINLKNLLDKVTRKLKIKNPAGTHNIQITVIANRKILETAIYLLLQLASEQNKKPVVKVEEKPTKVILIVRREPKEGYLKEIEKVMHEFIKEAAEKYKGKYVLDIKKGENVSRLILPKAKI